jgi:hypothetical protein
MNLEKYPTPETDDAACYPVHEKTVIMTEFYTREAAAAFVPIHHARNLEQRLALCRDALKGVIESAHPHHENNPAMFAAFKAGREALEATKPKTFNYNDRHRTPT